MKEGMKGGAMIDNRKVKDSHQEGISRVIQRKSEREHIDGHSGKMGMGHKSSAGFKRMDGDTPPCKA